VTLRQMVNANSERLIHLARYVKRKSRLPAENLSPETGGGAAPEKMTPVVMPREHRALFQAAGAFERRAGRN